MKVLVVQLIILSICVSCGPAAPTQPPVATIVKAFQVNTLQAVAAATLNPPTETAAPTATEEPTLAPTQPLPTPTRLTLAACIPAGAQIQTVQVTSIVDGDTIAVRIDGQEYKVRYIGINTPEDTTTHESFGPEATAANRKLVEGQTVTLVKDVSEVDRYGRLLRYVFIGGTFVNAELVRQGLAAAVDDPPDSACYSYFHLAEQEANAKRVGLWSRPAPTQTPIGLGAEKAPGVTGCKCDGPMLNCKSFSTQEAAQSCYNYCIYLGLGDIFHLDGDENGQACDSLP